MTDNRQQPPFDENSSGRRLEHLLKSSGRDLGWLSKQTDIPRTTLSDAARGGIKGVSQAIAIARVLNVSVEWLLTGGGERPAEISAAPDAEELGEQLGIVKIDEVDIAVGMGAGFLDEGEVTAVARWIPAEWVRQFTEAPANMLAIARPFGDSMYPTINDRDIILFDRSTRRIDRQDAIWVLVYGGLGTIKRVRALADGSYRLSGDNPAVRDETAHDEEMYVIGRVVGVIRRT